ncbi:DUF92 domain-containing protein [Candidatus Poribacteria bacterium]|nr:DUF92 domain-containing protein [Candidatus Poribacteria bacterium]
MMTDFILALGIFAGVGFCLTLFPLILRRFHVSTSHHVLRNVTHTIGFLLCVLAVYLVEEKWALIATGLIAAIFLIVAIEWKWMPAVMEGSRRRDYGIVASAVGGVTVVGLFFPQKGVISAAFLVVGLADPIASAVGRRFGRHTLTAWGCRRSIEGSLAFATVTLAISLVFFSANGDLSLRAIGFSTFIALTTAMLELVVPSAVDNLAISVWAAFLFFLTQKSESEPLLSWPIAVLASALFGPLVYRLKWVDAPGTVTSMFLGAVAIALGGWEWLVPVAVFFSSGSLLTKFRQTEKSAKKPRRIEQAVVNGVIPILPVIGHAIDGRPIWYLLSVGAVAVANADTWATEIGRFSRRLPISLRTLQPVPRGTSGAISFLGTLASLCGGVLIGAVAAATGPSEWRLGLLLVGTIAGPFGALIDSVIGAFLQCRYQCAVCGEIGEEANHCGVPGQRVSGVRGINNDMVNAIANVMGMFISLMLYYYIIRS